MAASADPPPPHLSRAAAADSHGATLLRSPTGAAPGEPLSPRSAPCEAAKSGAGGRSPSPAPSGRGDRGDGADARPAKRSSGSGSGSVSKKPSYDNVARLSAAEMQRLTSAPESLPVAPAPPQRRSIAHDLVARTPEQLQAIRHRLHQKPPCADHYAGAPGPRGAWPAQDLVPRPQSPRTVSTPPTPHVPAVDGFGGPASVRRSSFGPVSYRPPPLEIGGADRLTNGPAAAQQLPPPPPPPSSAVSGSPGPRLPSPASATIPLPPMSLPTHLQLELAAQRPSPLYIHHSHVDDAPYESNAVKLERLKNVLLLPPILSERCTLEPWPVSTRGCTPSPSCQSASSWPWRSC